MFDSSSLDWQNGLMVAVGKGFVDIVTMLHVCPLIDINHQDNDGNTALMIAAQAGWYAGRPCKQPPPSKLTTLRSNKPFISLPRFHYYSELHC